MKRFTYVFGSIAFSMLVYTCSVSKYTATEKYESPYPDRSFNPTPTAAMMKVNKDEVKEVKSL